MIYYYTVAIGCLVTGVCLSFRVVICYTVRSICFVLFTVVAVSTRIVFLDNVPSVCFNTFHRSWRVFRDYNVSYCLFVLVFYHSFALFYAYSWILISCTVPCIWYVVPLFRM